MRSVNDTIARKQGRSSFQIHKRTMQGQISQVMGRGYTGEHEMRNRGVEDIKVGEIIDRYRCECQIPRQIRIEKATKDKVL